ncbi:MAG: dephospho-CoA kinase [Chitinophagaceae bacterium]|nr:MAG: dephospho-CoA kinase [Chitinophagaceae bacterium]
MLKIGITGGIGSGKTTVCTVFELLGIPVYYADQVAKDIMIADQELISALKSEFGQETYFEDGSLNRKYLSNLVFNNNIKLEKLNALVHPAVFRHFDNWVAAQSSMTPYIVKEAALLFESGSFKMCDYNMLVIAPQEVRIERVMARDQVDRAAVMARIEKQLSDDEKREKADHVIYNDEDHSIIKQVIGLHEKFLSHI